MICEHVGNTLKDNCFVAKSGYDELCNDCPCPDKIKKYLETPSVKVERARAKQLLLKMQKIKFKKKRIL